MEKPNTKSMWDLPTAMIMLHVIAMHNQCLHAYFSNVHGSYRIFLDRSEPLSGMGLW